MLQHDYEWIAERASKYAELVKAGTIRLASWDHFGGWIWESTDGLSKLIAEFNEAERAVEAGEAEAVTLDSKKMRCGAELKKLATFIRGEYQTNANWGGALSAKAIYLNKLAIDGRSMHETQEVQNTGGVTISVKFGGGVDDPFG